MKKFMIILVALISILAMTSSGRAYTVTVKNIYGGCGLEYMATVNFYYNAVVNVKAETAYIAGGAEYTYNSGAWCPSGVTGIMNIRKKNDHSKQWNFIIKASDNTGYHGSGLGLACQSSTFYIGIEGDACSPDSIRDNQFIFFRE